MGQPLAGHPKTWYDRAAEMRALAEDLKNDEARQKLLRLADDYDKLADRAAEQEIRNKQAAQLGRLRRRSGGAAATS